MKAEDIFLAALEQRTPAERQAYLSSACGDDAYMRADVEGLIHSHEQAGSFLNAPLLDLPATIDDSGNSTAGPARKQDEIPLDFLSPSEDSRALGRIGPYDVTALVGRGGMGVVLRARDAKLNRVVAIKVMAPELASNPTARKRFVREAQAAAAVVHQHVVTIHAVDEDRLPYLVMEYIDGQSLQEKIDREGHLKLVEILRIGQQIAAGLAAAHAHGLIHRDVKPANILLENGVERVRITDFGLARAVDDVSMTRTGDVAGTPQYMSPEQAQGLALDARSDLFSFGCVLYAMCTGRPPFRAETAFATARRVCDHTPRPVCEVNAEAPPWLVEIVDRLLAKQPIERFQSAAEVAELLGRHLAQVQHPSAITPVAVTGAPTKLVGVTSPEATHQSARSEGLIWRSEMATKRRWAIAAAVLLCLGVGFGLAEATGTTQLAANVIRIFTPSGTLVVETDDPAMKVTIEGDGGLVIAGAGLHEVRLKPGSYKVHAAKDGKPVRLDQELVTITRGDKQVVRVRLEAIGLAKAIPPLVPRAVLEGHNSWVHSLAFSPDGKTLATGSNDQRVRLWDTATGNFTGQFHADDGMITSLAYSPDGTVLVTASNQCKVRVWDAATFKLLAEAKHDAFVGKLAFRKGDAMLATASDDKTVKLWKWDGAVLVPVRTLGEHSSGVSAMSFNPQGTVIASATRDGMLYLWDVESGKPLKSVRLSLQMLLCLAFSPDGTTLAAGGLDKKLELRKADTLEFLGTLRGHKEWVYSLVFLPDGKTVVSAGAHSDMETRNSKRPGELKLWDTARLKERLSVDGYETGIRCVALSADGKTLATGDISNLGRLWDVDALLAAARVRETASAGDTPERGAFVLLGGKGVAERKFDSLADAVLGASDGDTIEVRGNGPFLAATVEVKRPLTIRAGKGFWPVLTRKPLDEEKLALLTTDSALVVEGLEFQDLDNNPQRQRKRALLECFDAPLLAANCRFVSAWATNMANRSPRVELRNCEVLCSWDMAAMIAWVDSPSEGALRLQNCVSPNWGVFLMPSQNELKDIDIEFVGNSFAQPLLLSCFSGGELWNDGTNPRPFRVKATNNVLRTQSIFRVEMNRRRTDIASWPVDRVEKLANLLLDWQGEHNVYAPTSGFELWHQLDATKEFGRTKKSRADWQQIWGGKEANAVEGEIRFQDGQLQHRVLATPYLITPQDFRLADDSAGKGAGPDGKDLGANVDLVGPGPAYERWKKTPEYQQWLKDTGQNVNPGVAWRGWPENAPPPAVAPFDSVQAKAHQQAWAKHLNVSVEQTNSLGMHLALIPPGEFTMGTPHEVTSQIVASAGKMVMPHEAVAIGNESAPHRVRLTKPFLLGKFEVTHGQFRRFVETTGYKTLAERNGLGGWSNFQGKWVRRPEHVWSTPGEWEIVDDEPVCHVAWDDARAFCGWLSEIEGRPYALPTEAQWEHACRAGTTGSTYAFDTDARSDIAWTSDLLGQIDSARHRPQPVGRKQPNAFGLYDMLGNVWEFCSDYYGPSPSRSNLRTDPTGPAQGDLHVLRGGAWYRSGRLFARCGARLYADADDTTDAGIGFRVCVTGDLPLLSNQKERPASAPDENEKELEPKTSAAVGATTRVELAKWQGEWENAVHGRLVIKGERWSSYPKRGVEVLSTIKIVEVTDEMTYILLLNGALTDKCARFKRFCASMEIHFTTAARLGPSGPQNL